MIDTEQSGKSNVDYVLRDAHIILVWISYLINTLNRQNQYRQVYDGRNTQHGSLYLEKKEGPAYLLYGDQVNKATRKELDMYQYFY